MIKARLSTRYQKVRKQQTSFPIQTLHSALGVSLEGNTGEKMHDQTPPKCLGCSAHAMIVKQESK